MTEPSAGAGQEWGRVERDRLAKLDALRERGVAPYAYGFDRTHEAAEAVRLLPEGREEGEVVRVAGRIVGVRDMGKSTFAHLADRTWPTDRAASSSTSG
jgi:lysyl-tRNA synthetase, class II